MVFYIIAAKDHSHEDEGAVENTLRNHILGSGPKSNGELYNVEVIHIHIMFCIPRSY